MYVGIKRIAHLKLSFRLSTLYSMGPKTMAEKPAAMRDAISQEAATYEKLPSFQPQVIADQTNKKQTIAGDLRSV